MKKGSDKKKTGKSNETICMKCKILEEALLNKNRALTVLSQDLMREKTIISDLRKEVEYHKALLLIEQRRNTQQKKLPSKQ